MSVQEIYRHAGPGVLQVTSTSVDSSDPFFGPQARVSLGSGFVIDKDGYIVTNYHVIEGARQIEVNFSGDDRVPARIVGSRPLHGSRRPQDQRAGPRSDSPPPG